MDKRINLLNILNAEGKLSKVILYPAIETISDPYELTKDKSFLNPITIKALVQQISFEALKWKYSGQAPSGSVQILCDRKYEGLLKIADKIKIGDNYYSCWKDDSKNFMCMRRDDYIIFLLGPKND